VAEDSGKSGVAVFIDCRLGYTFSGLAELHKGSRIVMRTRFWLQEALLQASRPGLPAAESIEKFRAIATEEFERLRKQGVSAVDRRFSLLLGGFTPNALGIVSPQVFLVSNYERFGPPLADEASQDFIVESVRTPVNQCQVVTTAVDPSCEKLEPAFRLLKKERVPPSEVVNAAVQVIRKRVTADGAIGPRCSSLVMSREPGQEIVTDYHPDGSVFETHSPGLIYARFDEFGAYSMVDASSWAENEGEPFVLAVPRVARNHPCPCGSGIRYRRCHGRQRGRAQGSDSFGSAQP
jgi:hypothetical protein